MQSASAHNHQWIEKRSPIVDGTYLAVQVQQIECKEAYADLDVLHLDILALPSGQLLEGEKLGCVLVDGHSLSVEHKRVRTLLDTLCVQCDQMSRSSESLLDSSGGLSGSGNDIPEAAVP